jgi:hypothetical protein
MQFICKRTHYEPDCTLGEVTLNGQWVCYTLEDAMRQVIGWHVDQWKIAGKTAIPIGAYRLVLQNSPRFGPDTLTLLNVPGFVGIRIHAGNTHEDTEGCPLVGLRLEGNRIAGGTSAPALEKLKGLVREAIRNEEAIYWTITQDRS